MLLVLNARLSVFWYAFSLFCCNLPAVFEKFPIKLRENNDFVVVIRKVSVNDLPTFGVIRSQKIQPQIKSVNYAKESEQRNYRAVEMPYYTAVHFGGCIWMRSFIHLFSAFKYFQKFFNKISSCMAFLIYWTRSKIFFHISIMIKFCIRHTYLPNYKDANIVFR